jgi:hypothetical protein
MARNNAIQIRRGADSSVPSSSMLAGEPLFSTDNGKFYIATAASTKSWIGSPVLDQNDMSSDSATSLATQQSIKAYVDDSVAAKDALSELVDTTISSAQSGEMILWDGSNSWDNKSMSGDATLNSSGVLTIAANAVEGSMINSNAAGDGLGYASNSLKVNLGSSLEIDSDAVQVTAGGITNAMLAGSIANAKLSNSVVTMGDNGAGNDGNSTGSEAVALGGSMKFSGTDNEVTVAHSSGVVTIGLPDDVTIAGDLTVQGDTVTTNVETVTIEDPLVAYASANSGNAVDIGFYGKYVASGTKYCGFNWDQNGATGAEFILWHGNQAAPSSTVNTGGTGYTLSALRLGSIHSATVDGGTY